MREDVKKNRLGKAGFKVYLFLPFYWDCILRAVRHQWNDLSGRQIDVIWLWCVKWLQGAITRSKVARQLKESKQKMMNAWVRVVKIKKKEKQKQSLRSGINWKGEQERERSQR